MKSINELVIEGKFDGKPWYEFFLQVFNQDGEPQNILKGGNVRNADTSKPLKVEKYGTKASDVFGISYFNTAGVKMSYQFSIPNPRRGFVINNKVDSNNKYVQQLIQKNIKKLPYLLRDSNGNITN